MNRSTSPVTLNQPIVQSSSIFRSSLLFLSPFFFFSSRIPDPASKRARFWHAFWIRSREYELIAIFSHWNRPHLIVEYVIKVSCFPIYDSFIVRFPREIESTLFKDLEKHVWEKIKIAKNYIIWNRTRVESSNGWEIEFTRRMDRERGWRRMKGRGKGARGRPRRRCKV